MAAVPNWVVVVLGNIFVCAMEGLIVGIQVLRLEYYEIFSRFYAGNGREFKPFMKAAHKINTAGHLSQSNKITYIRRISS